MTVGKEKLMNRKRIMVLLLFVFLCFVFVGQTALAAGSEGGNGNIVAVLEQYFLAHPWLMIMGAVGVIVVFLLVPRSCKYALLILYVLFVLYMTLLGRGAKAKAGMKLELFWSIRNAIRSKAGWAAWGLLIGNVCFFIPLGFMLSYLHPGMKKNRVWIWILVCIGFSVAIEILQYVTGRGFMDVDDVVCNGMGAAIGAALRRRRGMNYKV